MSDAAKVRSGWVLGPRADALIFTGPIVLAFAFIAFAARRGFLDEPLPPLGFALLIIACDVAHVYATAFRVYLDPAELARRSGLYLGVPIACLLIGVALHESDPRAFWRALAYLALFHFVRQQWGWVAYSRRAAGETSRWERRFDQLAIYNATLFPLLWWHAHLPRDFVWFVQGDFQPHTPVVLAAVGSVVHFTILGAYFGWQLIRLVRRRGVNWAKLQIIVTTWIAWYGGIVWISTDVAFTSLNVLSHGVPYLAVVYRLERDRRTAARAVAVPGPFERAIDALFRPRRAMLFLGVLVAVGYLEEWGWDALVWHEHAGLFAGPRATVGGHALSLAVALLAVPQATHYVLDGWIWRTARHPELDVLFRDPAVRR